MRTYSFCTSILMGLLLLGALVSPVVKAAPPSGEADRMTAQERLSWYEEQGHAQMGRNVDSAYIYCSKMVELADSLGLIETKVDGIASLASILMNKGFYDEGLKTVYQGIEIAKELDNSALSELLLIEGAMYVYLGEHQKAASSFQKSLELTPGDKKSIPVAKILGGMAESERLQGNYDKALDLHLEFQSIFKHHPTAPERQKYRGMIIAQNNLALLMYDQGELEKAQMHLDTFHNYQEKHKMIPVLMEGNLCQVKIWSDQGKSELAKNFAKEMIEVASQNGLKKYELEYADWLNTYYRSNGHADSALFYTDRTNQLRQAANTEEARFRVFLKSQDVERAQLEAENASLSSAKRTRGIFIWSLVIGLGGLGLGLIVLLRKNVRIRSLNDRMNEKNGQLEKANLEINGLIGILAHDLKSPLNNSIMLSETLRGEGVPEGLKVKTIDLIQKACNNGIDLIGDLLELNQEEANETNVKLEKVVLRDLVQETTELFKPQALNKEIDLQVNVQEFDDHVHSDGRLLARILANLVSNALKFTSPEKKVIVSTYSSPKGPVISIKDEGQGISLEDQKKMFSRFQRLTAQPTGGESSHGLGLAIVKILTDKLRIKIELESEVGKGTEFKLLIPVAPNDI